MATSSFHVVYATVKVTMAVFHWHSVSGVLVTLCRAWTCYSLMYDRPYSFDMHS
jgi:hypothetical protein